jgi:hypothetical protein
VAPIPGLLITVPDLSVPVWVWGKAIIDPLPPIPDSIADAISSNDAMELAIGPASETQIALDAVIDSSHQATTYGGGTPFCCVRLDPHSPGDYQLFATRTAAGNLRILTPEHSQARIAAFATQVVVMG